MRGEEKGSMGSRKKVDRNQSKNTFMNEKQTNKKKTNMLGRWFLVRKLTGNKPFQPVPLQIKYFELDKISSHFSHLAEVKKHQ